MRFLTRGAPLLLAAVLLLSAPVGATTMLQFDLGQLTDRADRIFRGTVVDVSPGTIEAGGGVLPITIYRLEVEEMFKGQADQVKGDQSMIEIRMVGSIKSSARDDDLVRFDIARDVPRLSMGSDYLLFTTRPGASGLSTTVGLGQGAFSVFWSEKEEFAVNEFDNLGLGLGQAGPVPYSELAAKIAALLGQ